jgi:hypothetical protein
VQPLKAKEGQEIVDTFPKPGRNINQGRKTRIDEKGCPPNSSTGAVASETPYRRPTEAHPVSSPFFHNKSLSHLIRSSPFSIFFPPPFASHWIQQIRSRPHFDLTCPQHNREFARLRSITERYLYTPCVRTSSLELFSLISLAAQIKLSVASELLVVDPVATLIV